MPNLPLVQVVKKLRQEFPGLELMTAKLMAEEVIPTPDKVRGSYLHQLKIAGTAKVKLLANMLENQHAAIGEQITLVEKSEYTFFHKDTVIKMLATAQEKPWTKQ